MNQETMRCKLAKKQNTCGKQLNTLQDDKNLRMQKQHDIIKKLGKEKDPNTRDWNLQRRNLPHTK